MTITRAKLWASMGSVTLAGGALLLAGLVSAASTSSAASFPLSALAEALPPELHDVDRELRRVGLDPQSLAAAGLSAADTTALATRAITHLDAATYASLRQAMAAHGSAKAEMQRLQRLFRAGTPGDATQADLDAAVALEASTRATMEARQQDLYDAATLGLGATALARLSAIGDEDQLSYPDYFKVVNRTHAQGIALRNALNGVRIDNDLGQEPSDHHQAIIDAQLADPAINAAKAAYDANLQDIKNAWDGVFGPA